MITKIANVQTEDRNINQLQQNIQQIFNQLVINPFLSGNYLPQFINGQAVPFTLYGSVVTALALQSAKNPTELYHGLGAPLLGYFVLTKSANSQVWDSQSLNVTSSGYQGPDKTLLINVSSDATLTLYVF